MADTGVPRTVTKARRAKARRQKAPSHKSAKDKYTPTKARMEITKDDNFQKCTQNDGKVILFISCALV